MKLVGGSYAIQMNIRLTIMGLGSLQPVMHESPQAWGKRVVALYACQVGSARIQRLLHVCYSVRAHAIDIVTRMAFSHLISALACSWPECVKLVSVLRIA